MEQDNIKDLEKYISFSKKSYNFSHDTDWKWNKELAEKIEHLIKAYKELESKYDRALSDLVKAEHKNKELEEENEFLKLKERSRVLGRYGEIEVHDLINKTLANDYIPVSLVEEKIEELNNSIDLAIDNSKGGLDEEFIEKGSELLAQKKVLQELLEKRK